VLSGLCFGQVSPRQTGVALFNFGPTNVPTLDEVGLELFHYLRYGHAVLKRRRDLPPFGKRFLDLR
jgi:hypothetical protein